MTHPARPRPAPPRRAARRARRPGSSRRGPTPAGFGAVPPADCTNPRRNLRYDATEVLASAAARPGGGARALPRRRRARAAPTPRPQRTCPRCAVLGSNRANNYQGIKCNWKLNS
jgi:hypothetical protein